MSSYTMDRQNCLHMKDHTVDRANTGYTFQDVSNQVFVSYKNKLKIYAETNYDVL